MKKLYSIKDSAVAEMIGVDADTKITKAMAAEWASKLGVHISTIIDIRISGSSEEE